MACCPKYIFFCFTSQDVDVYISGLYLERDVFILSPTSTIAPVKRVDDDIHGKQLDARAAHHYLICPIDDKWLGSTGNYHRCRPAGEDPPAPEGHPSTGLGICRAKSATNIGLITPQSLYM